jgi:hypothetical protein
MRTKVIIIAAALMSAAAPTSAFAGWWPWYSYYGYDSAFGYYGAPAAGPDYRYIPPRPQETGPVCNWRRYRVVDRRGMACF